MAPQEHIPTAASILGTIGTGNVRQPRHDAPPQQAANFAVPTEDAGVFSVTDPPTVRNGAHAWLAQSLTQNRIYTNWRHKQTDGLPWIMPFLWAVAAMPFGVYNIVQNFNIPLQVQPQVFCSLTLICWAQTLIYHEHWRVWTATLAAVITGLVSGGVEALLILTLRGPYSRGVEWPIITVGVVAAILLAVGLLPMYWEQWKRDGRAKDISFLFLGTDFAGATFSLIALAVQQTFDYLGGILYIVCMVLEIGIVIWHLSWVYRNRRTLKAAKRAGLSYDQYVSDDPKPPKTSGSYITDYSRNNSLTPHTTLDKDSDAQSEKIEDQASHQGDTERDVERVV
ncbi:pq loop repeat protein [Diplodia corticola]|uniref:Pq loop repeat protein n=1 Tax=Diplodia corticola TaxID=236234 RepID=A0A1J9R4C0_9PEZI|nr:pq loop repeat protein [Diplodia corticola]OJD35074.1 pq loop repeat protein [Diplodia corticola]